MKPKQLKHPEVIIIYTPGDKQAHLVGAHRNKWRKWLYSKPTVMPEPDLNEFLKGLLESGFAVTDLRALANLKVPGMGAATPILVTYPGVEIGEAAQAAALLHRAVLALPEDESTTL